MPDDARYGIAELADLGGVTRRTVRYYVQEGLLPPPLGVGRGDHYGAAHLERLLQVKALQEAGRSLDDIRGLLAAPASSRHGVTALERPLAAAVAPAARPLPRQTWRRLTLAPGVELHVGADVRLPSPGRLQELAAWCRLHLVRDRATDTEDSDA